MKNKLKEAIEKRDNLLDIREQLEKKLGDIQLEIELLTAKIMTLHHNIESLKKIK